jgi:hypothetical protein
MFDILCLNYTQLLLIVIQIHRIIIAWEMAENLDYSNNITLTCHSRMNNIHLCNNLLQMFTKHGDYLSMTFYPTETPFYWRF